MIQLVLGRKGYGKTTFTKDRLKSFSRVLVFDTLSEYGGQTEPYFDLDGFLRAVERRQNGVFRLSLVPLSYGNDPAQAFDVFMRAGWIVGNVVLVVDEIDAVSSPTSVPPSLARAIRYGRHRGLSIIASSRRAAEVPRLLTSQADEIISFNQSEPTDLDYLRRYVSARFSESVQRLPKYRFLRWTPDYGADVPLPLDRREDSGV